MENTPVLALDVRNVHERAAAQNGSEKFTPLVESFKTRSKAAPVEIVTVSAWIESNVPAVMLFAASDHDTLAVDP
jgi:hypothetical protein